MQNRDAYKLLYNNLWLHKRTPAIIPKQVERVIKPHLEIAAMKDQLTHSPTVLAPIMQATKSLEVGDTTIPRVRLIDNWDTLVDSINNCAKCKLCHSRQNVVIERGSRHARWMFVGEGPGEQEDIQGKPFVGASGQLLQKMIAAMQLDPDQDVYICNVVKCRPPANRNPEIEEIELCQNYLFSQIELIKPDIIITLGRFAHQTLLKTNEAVGRLRLKQHYYQKIPLVVTYHPAYLLRNPSAKKDAWADLQLAMQIYKDRFSVS
jgi:DNA polymerase